MAAGGGAMADAFISLGDKLHNNFNATTNMLGNLRQGDEELALKRQELELARRKQAMEMMLSGQEYQDNARKMQWMRDFARAGR